MYQMKMSETTKFVMQPEQCRMARGALHWTVEELARQAQLAKNTVMAFEAGRSVRGSSVQAMQDVFEDRGIQFDTSPTRTSVTLTKSLE